MADETKPAVRFHLSDEAMNTVELGEILALEENPNDVRIISQFMMHFIVDEQGKLLPEAEAKEAIKRVTIGQLRSAFEQVSGGLGETAVPNG